MQSSHIKKLSLVAMLSVAFSPFTHSADIARELRTNADNNSVPDNFFEIGVNAEFELGSSLTDEDAKGFESGINVSGSYNWNNFFIDVGMETSEPLVIGYNAYKSDNWSFDLILGATEGGISKDTNDRFIGITKRQSSTMLGGRLTGYFGKNILQVSIKHDVRGRSKGTVASALLGRNWQVNDWNFQSLAGITVADARFNDYYLGVSNEESNQTNFAAYDGKVSVNFNSSVGVTYPISENWEFRAAAHVGSDFGYNDSPLFSKKRDFYTGISSSITYEF
jgi:outer membrane scaffolding protein for murein synthesis (MipA/OmpV family)